MIIMGQKYMVYFHGTERIWVEHTHRTDGFFFFFIVHRCRGIYTTWKRWELRNIGRGRKLVHLRRLKNTIRILELKEKRSRIRVFRLEIRSWRSKRPQCTRNIVRNCDHLCRNKELERDRDRIRVADITRRKHQFFPFNPDFVTNRTRHLVKFS